MNLKVGQAPTNKSAEKQRKAQEKKAKAEAKKREQAQKKEQKKREKEAKKRQKAAEKGQKSSKPKKEKAPKDPNAPKRNIIGMKKKKPRAEYQAEIDELKLAYARQGQELQRLKTWARSAPV